MAQAYIVDYLRSPFALARKGDLAGVRPDDLAAGVVSALSRVVRRTLGHPLRATRARLVGKAAQLLKRDGGRNGLATQCIGDGRGIALVLEAAG